LIVAISSDITALPVEVSQKSKWDGLTTLYIIIENKLYCSSRDVSLEFVSLEFVCIFIGFVFWGTEIKTIGNKTK